MKHKDIDVSKLSEQKLDSIHSLAEDFFHAIVDAEEDETLTAHEVVFAAGLAVKMFHSAKPNKNGTAKSEINVANLCNASIDYFAQGLAQEVAVHIRENSDDDEGDEELNDGKDCANCDAQNCEHRDNKDARDNKDIAELLNLAFGDVLSILTHYRDEEGLTVKQIATINGLALSTAFSVLQSSGDSFRKSDAQEGFTEGLNFDVTEFLVGAAKEIKKQSKKNAKKGR